MQIDVILEVAIGLVVVWFVLSMATSQIQEIIADVGGRRSKFMRSQIEEMFQEDGKGNKPFTKQFFEDDIIESLKIQPTLWGGETRSRRYFINDLCTGNIHPLSITQQAG